MIPATFFNEPRLNRRGALAQVAGATAATAAIAGTPFVGLVQPSKANSPVLTRGVIRQEEHKKLAKHCVLIIRAVEKDFGIPRNLLLAIALIESGRPVEGEGGSAPWPWSLNIAGTSKFLSQKNDAVQLVQQSIETGNRNIDIGVCQINARYHLTEFQSVSSAIDPETNIRYAAHYLTLLQTRHAKKTGTVNWAEAVSDYHHQRNTFLRYRYLCKVAKTQRLLSGRDPHVDYCAS